jgi:hypothetical protein
MRSDVHSRKIRMVPDGRADLVKGEKCDGCREPGATEFLPSVIAERVAAKSKQNSDERRKGA